jgi:hypothetical protein
MARPEPAIPAHSQSTTRLASDQARPSTEPTQIRETAATVPPSAAAPSPQADGDTRPPAMIVDGEDRRQQIELLAYLRYVDRGREPGAALDDWLEAERQLDGRQD